MTKDLEKLGKYELEERVQILKASLIDGISGAQMHEGMGYKLSRIANGYNFYGRYTGTYSQDATEEDIRAFVYAYPDGIEDEYPTFDDFLKNRVSRTKYEENYGGMRKGNITGSNNLESNFSTDFNGNIQDNSKKYIIGSVIAIVVIFAIYKVISWIGDVIFGIGLASADGIYIGIVVAFLIASIVMWIYKKSHGMGVFKRIIMVIGLYFAACSFAGIYELLALHSFEWTVIIYGLIAYFAIRKTIFE
ncbi:Yip1 family protein [Clostridium beijerinckii]|uniref:DUF1129 family protein n=1 Tax=Clostridium beijerinckii TaxID=1520 RepID=A0AB74VIJ6_CLOBE|nr:Yip1 family protein [Clostridium beijerinckii]NRZ25369.1 hypothetical protein [Clostridium beijerinckii]NYB97885.1 hypothetical protein [Clostridium beijerinckii]QUN36137.1 hypothetical protein KEC93_04770 [Clostridium beijerinckii]